MRESRGRRAETCELSKLNLRVGSFSVFDGGPKGRRLFERKVDTLPAYMAVKERTDLTLDQAFRAGDQRLTDAFGGGIDGRASQKRRASA